MADSYDMSNEEPRWDIISNVYQEIENILCNHINNDKLTFIELETIIKLLSLRLLSAEIKHLTSTFLTQFYNLKDDARCYR